MVKNQPANRGDTQVRSLVWVDPHAAEQLSPCTTTPEPVL